MGFYFRCWDDLSNQSIHLIYDFLNSVGYCSCPCHVVTYVLLPITINWKEEPKRTRSCCKMSPFSAQFPPIK
ncbi:hypothetical protein AQUCO_03000181v1 [Aquilegia coerulea]|uniref:Uncharacterized protein n=1 Tax=Aquilegia coerulea TaxID=218851 RepID=A0A2G5D1M4_AQUCA|nr:hypothetical protein AQUCO_03000181v1 [Aquilegia coerulea]